MASLRHAVSFITLILAGMLGCRAPLLADEAPWLPVSKVMAELSQNPDFVEALYKRLGRDPKAGGILGPDEIKRLRELILGRNFEALDRFPGMTVQGMGRAVRLAAATMNDAGNKVAPQPERTGRWRPSKRNWDFPPLAIARHRMPTCGPWVSDWKPATGSTRCWPADMPIACGLPRC